jgi:hypothetical protein
MTSPRFLSPFCVSFNGINIELLTLVFGSHYKQILNGCAK